MNALMKEAPAITPATDVAGRVKALDWERVSLDLDVQGCASMGLRQQSCENLR